MTKKDFELIARVLRTLQMPYLLTNDDHTMVVQAFAAALESTNPRFDRERFIAAATLEG